MIRSFISNKSEQDKIDTYENFLNDFFSFKLTSFVIHFTDIPENEKIIFMYHFGPVYFFKLVLNEMRETKCGFVHQFLKNNQMIRELPIEYLKKSLGHWWDENVFQKTRRVERNSKEIYNRFARMVTSSWQKEQPILLKKIAENPEAIKAYNFHNLNLILPHIISEISHMFYLGL